MYIHNCFLALSPKNPGSSLTVWRQCEVANGLYQGMSFYLYVFVIMELLSEVLYGSNFLSAAFSYY